MSTRPTDDIALKPIAKQAVVNLSVRYDAYGQLRLMAVAEGYVMCRRARSAPFVMTLGDWLELPQERVA